MSQYPPMYQAEPPPPKKSNTLKIVLIILGVLGALTLCCCGSCIVWIMMQPEGGTRTGSNMEQYATDYLNQHRVLDPGEQVVAYYDISLSMDGSEAAILTSDRLIYHNKGANTVIRLKDVDSIDYTDNGILSELIIVRDSQGTLISIDFVPTDGSQLFLNLLEGEARRHGYEPSP